jgi:hypothetical protein
MFTKSSERLIIRGNRNSVSVDGKRAKTLAEQGFRWSGHTHPGVGRLVLLASDGDMEVLNYFPHKQSVIYNSSGEYLPFEKE